MNILFFGHCTDLQARTQTDRSKTIGLLCFRRLAKPTALNNKFKNSIKYRDSNDNVILHIIQCLMTSQTADNIANGFRRYGLATCSLPWLR